MNVTAGLAAATIVAGAAVGFASPARADDFSGTFIPNGPGLHSTWVVTPCGQDCTHIADSTGWSVDAHPWEGLWRFVVDLPDGVPPHPLPNLEYRTVVANSLTDFVNGIEVQNSREGQAAGIELAANDGFTTA